MSTTETFLSDSASDVGDLNGGNVTERPHSMSIGSGGELDRPAECPLPPRFSTISALEVAAPCLEA